MTQEYFPFDAGDGANAQEDQWRKMGRQWLQPGVLLGVGSTLAVSQHGGGDKSVDVAAGAAWVNGHYFSSSATENLAVADNASGNARIDLVVIRLDTVANTIALAVLQGTPAGSPAAPALTQTDSTYEIPLAQLAVANGFTQILTANITDRRGYAHAARSERACSLDSDATVSQTAYNSGSAFIARGPLMPYRAMINLGLKLQVRIVARIVAGSSSSVQIAAGVNSGDLAGNALDDAANLAGEVTSSSTSGALVDSGWVDLNPSVTVKDFVAVTMFAKRGGSNNGTAKFGSAIFYRWVPAS